VGVGVGHRRQGYAAAMSSVSASATMLGSALLTLHRR
jgi:hypothetical protein